jgi:amino acid transporter
MGLLILLMRCFPCMARSKVLHAITDDESVMVDVESVQISDEDATGKSTDTFGGGFLPIQRDPTQFRVRVIDIWCLGITIVIGGQYFSWNEGLTAGFGSYAVATALIATGYVCLCFSMAELSSTLPFAGGGYGLARVTLGYYMGFLIGICEVIEYIVYVAFSVYTLGDMITEVTGMDPALAPLVWLAFYVSAVSVYVRGGRLFWRINMGLALTSIAVVLIYCLGSLKFVDFRYVQFVTWDTTGMGDPSTSATIAVNSGSSGSSSSGSSGSSGSDSGSTGNPWFVGGMAEFMHVLPLPAWFYVGVESLNFACTDISEVREGQMIEDRWQIALYCSVLLCGGVCCWPSLALQPPLHNSTPPLPVHPFHMPTHR